MNDKGEIKMLELIKKNKKKTIYLVVGLLLIFGGIAYIIIGNNGGDEPKTSKTQKVEKAEKAEKTAKSEKVVDKITSKNTDLSKVTKVEGRLKDKTTGKAVKGVKLVGKPSKSGNSEITAKSGNTGNTVKPSVPSSQSTPSTPKPKEKQKVWIVDKPAWTETVQEPIYSTRDVFYASSWDNSEQATFYSLEECQKWLSKFDGGGYSISNEQYISGYNTKTINHPEQGHWEYR